MKGRWPLIFCLFQVAGEGRVLVAYSALGLRTTGRFTLWLPVGTAAGLPTGSQNVDSAGLRRALRGKQGLLVEDNSFNRLLARTTIEGVDMPDAVNSQLAATLAQQKPFDLVLMDVHKPVMDGFKATRQRRQG